MGSILKLLAEDGRYNPMIEELNCPEEKAVLKLNDRQYLVKKGNKFKIVYPLKKDPEKKEWKDNINTKNLLGGTNWIALILTMVIVLFGVVSYSYDTSVCRDVLENPQKYFEIVKPLDPYWKGIAALNLTSNLTYDSITTDNLSLPS